MTVRVEIAYQGELQCDAIHTPSGDRILTDAPADNHGKAGHFSPTDLVTAALGTCMLTIIAIALENKGYSLTGSRVSVDKDMESTPRRHIARLTVQLTLPASLDSDGRALAERAAKTCPVAASLGDSTKVVTTFQYQ